MNDSQNRVTTWSLKILSLTELANIPDKLTLSLVASNTADYILR